MKELLVVNQPWTSEIQKYLESTGLVMQLQYEHHSVSVVQATFSNWIQLFDFLAKYDSTVFEDKLIRVSIRSSNLAGKYSEYLWNSRMLVINPPLLHSQIDHSSFTLFGDIFFHHLYKLPLSQLRFFRQYQKKPVGFIQYRSPEVMKLAQVSMNKSYLAGNQISTRPFNNPDSLQLFKKCTAEFSLKVSNIPTNTTTKTQLVDLLYSFGHARLDKNRDDLLFHYENAHDRENAIRYFDKNTPFGTDIEVKSFLPLSESIALQRYNDACRVYFFNACPLADYKEIYDIFKLTGSIKSLVIDKRSNGICLKFG
ncbi:hypothetical protein BC833DRAFT_573628 [Globomyces pollinis-pini]|nr:hypothetical protein BC833DRAFT_573628 [Globomyces pollinis-pini]